MSWIDYVPGVALAKSGGLFDPRTEGQYGGVNRSNFDVPNFGGLQQQLQGMAGGQDSMAQERLRQGTAANMAQQQSMAAGAAPGNQAAAHLAAMQNSGRINQGMTGQATQAGIAERQAAMQGLMGLSQMQQQGGIAYEGNRAARAGAQMQQPTMGEQILGAGMGIAGMAMMKDGGVVTKPTHAIVGEAGPEAVIPLAKLPSILQAMQQASETAPGDSMNHDNGAWQDDHREQDWNTADPSFGDIRNVPPQVQQAAMAGPKWHGAYFPPITVTGAGGEVTGRTRRTGLDHGATGYVTAPGTTTLPMAYMKPSHDAAKGAPPPPAMAPRRILPGELAKSATSPSMPRTWPEWVAFLQGAGPR